MVTLKLIVKLMSTTFGSLSLYELFSISFLSPPKSQLEVIHFFSTSFPNGSLSHVKDSFLMDDFHRT